MHNSWLRNIYNSYSNKEQINGGNIKTEITDTLAPFLYEKTKRKPMILPIIMEV